MNPTVYKIGIALTPGVNSKVVEALVESDISLEEFFSLPMLTLSERLGAGHSLHLELAKRIEALTRAEREYEFMQRFGISGIFLTDDEYPPLLYELYDAPVMLFKLGEANLSAEHIMAIVGTRRSTAYGLNFVASLCEDMALCYPDINIVSGLALGIDSAAHLGALNNNLKTIAVVAHGLDMIYPAQNRELSRRIIQNGGAIVSEYPSGVKPFRGNFLERNRIIAGLSSVTVVAESEIKGGAMNTANIAFMNNREVMALPGRISDRFSSGCNQLIRQNKAHILTDSSDISLVTGWIPKTMSAIPTQKNLFPELDGLTKQIFELMHQTGEPVSADRLLSNLHTTMQELLSTLNDMEFDGIICRLPGGRYELA